MEGIGIDSIVRKAVTEYRKQEREAQQPTVEDVLTGMRGRSQTYLYDIALEQRVKELERMVRFHGLR